MWSKHTIWKACLRATECMFQFWNWANQTQVMDPQELAAEMAQNERKNDHPYSPSSQSLPPRQPLALGDEALTTLDHVQQVLCDHDDRLGTQRVLLSRPSSRRGVAIVGVRIRRHRRRVRYPCTHHGKTYEVCSTTRNHSVVTQKFQTRISRISTLFWVSSLPNCM